MNINKITALVPASFEYTYFDGEGNEAVEKIELQLRRMSFSSATNELQELINDKNPNASLMARIFVQIIVSWNIFTDDTEQTMLPITEEWFAGPNCPADFANQLATCIFEKLSGNPQKAALSPNGSEPAAPSNPASVESFTSDTDSPSLAASGA